jgi:predicted dienelactone hydrolase
MRPAASRLAALVLLSLPAPALAADGVGVRSISVVAPERAQPLAVTLWSPARDGDTPERVGENAAFEGVQAWRNADIADGAFPVVLLAHGGLRAAPNQSGWIGADLASRGMIVAAVQPSRPATPQAAVAESWRRAADLSATLTALEADAATAAHAVPGQAAAVGGFLGGAAGLALAGARLDAERFARSCDAPAQSPDCAWFAAAGVDLHAVDPATLTRSGLDPRIATVVAIDPELTASFAPDSLSDVEAQAPGTIARYLDASGLQAAMPGAPCIALPDASPMDAMAACKPQGAEILAAEGEDDAICRGDAAAREHAHVELATRIAEALGAR